MESELVFRITEIDKSQRTIRGVAHVETIDKDQEMILIKAIADALPDFMELPILTVDHLERPVGLITKAWIETLQFHLEAKIKGTKDCNDVWRRVEKGQTDPLAKDALNSFSIKGMRTDYTPTCLIPTDRRTSPCITKAINLWAVTLCGDNARNPLAYLDVVKAFAPEAAAELPPPSFVKTNASDTLAKPDDTVKSMVDTPESDPAILEKCSGTTGTTKKVETAAEAETTPPVTKAEPVPQIDFGAIFSKALAEQMPELAKAQADAMTTFAKAQDEKLATTVAEITKALETKFEERLATIEKTKVRLAPTVVMKAGKPVEISNFEDPSAANLAILQKAKGVY